ncbi:MAG TPA: hypothetical protein VFM38_07610 [Candidatus Limnocylindrales bacterium]|nr:hypothetical protein [Candidatus Limnocylindrales bacterium]
MIVVIGSLRLHGAGDDAEAVGLAASIAAAAATDGALVEVIARVGDDPPGDSLLLALARHHIGHVAVLRDPARSTIVTRATTDIDVAATHVQDDATDDEGPRLEAADANLALRYLPQASVIVAVHLADDVLAEAIDGAAWAESALVVVVPPQAGVPAGLPANAVTLEVEDTDDSAAGGAIGRYAAALDRGETPRDAYDGLVAAVSS